MKKTILILATLFIGSQAAFAVILPEAPRNKAVAFKKLYNCTNGEWKQVVRQTTNRDGINERYVAVKCVRHPKPGQKNTRQN